jgi:hypothetical protein
MSERDNRRTTDSLVVSTTGEYEADATLENEATDRGA